MGLEFVTGRIVRSPFWVKTPKVTYPAKTDVSPERGETPSFRRLKVTPRKGTLGWVLFMKCDVFQSDREATWKWGFSTSLLISKAKERIDWWCQYSPVIVKLDGWKNLIGRNFIFLSQVKNKTLSTVNAFPFSLVYAISPSKNDIRTTATFCLFSRTQGYGYIMLSIPLECTCVAGLVN